MATKATTIAAKKKKWVKIYAAKPFDEHIIIGETLVEEAEMAVGKPLLVNLSSLTGDFKSQNSNLKFIVDRIVEGRAHTKIIGYMVVPAALKRLVRRNSTKIDMSFEAVTADGVKIRLKPFILTRTKANTSISSAIRKQTEQFIKTNALATGFQNVIQDIVTNRFQMNVKKHLSKIIPVKSFEIRLMDILGNAEKPKTETVQAAEAPKQEAAVEKTEQQAPAQ